MKLGIFGARCDERGLGRLTFEAYRHLRPDRTLVIDMGSHAHGFPQRTGMYPDATVLRYNPRGLPEPALREFFRGLDVAYMAETPYDYRAFEIAREEGCRTVLHAMPELFKYGTAPYLPKPDVVWSPSSWRLDTMPGARIVPVPVAGDRFPMKPAGVDGEMRVLFVAGKRAAEDRNGASALYAALPRVRERMTVTIIGQERVAQPGLPRSSPVTVRVRSGGVREYPDLYAGQQVLVMPRRYGGLCLPAQEAAASGLALVMPGLAPQSVDGWPILAVPATQTGQFRAPAGLIPVHDVAPRDLARALDSLADPDLLARYQQASVDWAAARSWDALEPTYRAELLAVLE